MDKFKNWQEQWALPQQQKLLGRSLLGFTQMTRLELQPLAEKSTIHGFVTGLFTSARFLTETSRGQNWQKQGVTEWNLLLS